MKKILMRKVFLGITAFVCMVVLGICLRDVQINAATYNETIGGIKWNINVDANGQVCIYPADKSQITDSIVIPSTVAGKKVTALADSSFRGCSNLTQVTVPEGVTSLISGSFYQCENLEKVVLPSTLKKIDQYTFYQCAKLKVIEIPSGVIEIGKGAFWNCSSLLEVTIPSGVNKIAEFTFYGCSSLKKVEIPSGVTEIGGEAFNRCKSLVGVMIPNGVTKIGRATFYNCSSLVEVIIPSRVQKIEELTFSGCSSLKKMEIPSGVTQIGGDAFYGCRSLEKINIPSEVTEIGAQAFCMCRSLGDVTIPSKVEKMGYYVFNYCDQMYNINVSPENKVYSSVDGVLFNKNADTIIVIPSGRKDTYKIPSSTKVINQSAFNDANLEELWIPNSVKDIGLYAFDPQQEGDVQKLKRIFYEGNYSELLDMTNKKDESTKGTCIETVPNIYCMDTLIETQPVSSEYIQSTQEQIKPLSVTVQSNKEYPEGVSIVGTLSYQWYKNDENSNTGGTLIQGATEPTYTPPFENNTSQYYYCTVTRTYEDFSNAVTTEPANITMKIPECKITYINNYSINMKGDTVLCGNKLQEPTISIPEGFLFEGWYADESYTISYDFSKAVTENCSIYVKFSIDYSGLKNAVDSAGKIKENDVLLKSYDQESVSKFLALYDQAEYMLKSQNATSPADVISMIETLKQAENGLTKKLLHVTFVSIDGDVIAEQNVIYGMNVSVPETPIYEGYNFAGWYKTATFDEVFDFTKPVEQDITVYAKWTLDYSELEKLSDETKLKLSNESYVETYTTKTIQNLSTIYDAAKYMLENKTASTPEEILLMIDKLQNAMESLEKCTYLVEVQTDIDSSNPTGGGRYGLNDIVNLEASEVSGYQFSGWYTSDESKVSESLLCTIKVDETKTGKETYIAKYKKTNSVNVSTFGKGNVLVNDETFENDATVYVVKGDTITLKAVETAESKFMFWMDKDSNMILSQEAEFVVNINSERQFVAVFAKKSVDGKNVNAVVFQHLNGQLLQFSDTSSDIVPPEPLYRDEYEFVGWKIKGTSDNDLITDFSNITKDTFFESVYKKEMVTYDVRVEHGTIACTEGQNEKAFIYDSLVTVVADEPEQGMKFAYWTKDGEETPICYETTYSFYLLSEDINLTAVYEEEGKESTKMPLVFGTLSNVDYNNKALSYVIDWCIPEGFTFEGSGLIATKNSILGANENDEFVLGAAEINYTKVGSSQPKTPQFMWTKTNAEEKWYVRGYLHYRDKEGNVVTIYTPVIEGEV